MTNPHMNFAINQELPNEILVALSYPIKIFHSDYKNIDPVSLLEESTEFELDDSEENQMYFISRKEVIKRELDSISAGSNDIFGLQSAIESLRESAGKTYKEFLGVAKLESIEIHYVDIYLSKCPKIAFNNGVIQLADINIRVDYKITGHIKSAVGRKHIVLQKRGVEVQANCSVALSTVGTKLFANIYFDRLKLVLDFGFRFTFDLKKYLDPKSDQFEIFDVSTALLSIPSSTSKLALKGLTPMIGNGEFSVNAEFNSI